MKLFGAIEFFSGALDSREAVAYTLSATALKQLKAEGMPAEEEGVQALRALKGQRFERRFSADGREATGRGGTRLVSRPVTEAEPKGRVSSMRSPMRRSCARCWRESPCQLS